MLSGLASLDGWDERPAGLHRGPWLWLLLALIALLLLAWVGPVDLQKLNPYSIYVRFFSHYAERRELMFSTWLWRCRLGRLAPRALGPLLLWASPRSRVRELFALLFKGPVGFYEVV